MEEQDNKQIGELLEKLSLCEKERDEYLNGWKRAKADLINARKEWEERAGDISIYAQADLIEKLLPVADALDETKDLDGWQEIKKLWHDIFKKIGLEEIKTEGEEFNPEYHESVGHGEGPEHQVIEVVQKGYSFKGQVIRPSKVKIGKLT